MSAIIFTEEQEKKIKIVLGLVLTGRGKVVEDVSKEINENIFPLTEDKIKAVDGVVESFVYGGGVQEEMNFPERLNSGLDYIVQSLA